MEIIHYRIGGLNPACGRGPKGERVEQLDESAITCPSCTRNMNNWNAARWFRWALAAEEQGTAQPALDALYARALAKAKDERDAAPAFYEQVKRRGKLAKQPRD